MSAEQGERKTPPEQTTFEAAASQQAEPGLVRDFLGFLRHNKKWWLLPILGVLLLLGLLMLLSSSAAAPFIYTLF